MKQLLLFAITASVLLMANIDQTIEAIRKASPQEREQLMQLFKKEVVRMQEEERIKTIKKLKTHQKIQHDHNRSAKQ